MKAGDMRITRSNCFKLLSACFCEPEKELFLQDRLCENLAALLAEAGCGKASESAEKLKAELLNSSPDELRVDHARLFLGPFDLIAPPYGSVYLEKGRRLMGDSTMAVLKYYQDAGLALDIKEAPDHISLELEFMHFLCFREAEAASQDNSDRVNSIFENQSFFFRNFLKPWIPEFCSAIRRGADKSGFYAALADCLESFIEDMGSFYELTAIHQEKEADRDCRVVC